MAKVRLTKNELKRQKEDLERFIRYLPMLQLRKQQLQREVNRVNLGIRQILEEISSFKQQILSWVDLFAEEVGLEKWLSVEEVVTETGNIAGVEIPVFKKINFKENPYDLFRTPLWIDKGLEAVKKMIILKVRLQIRKKQEKILKQELRIATQRVNLFEKVKIPEAEENIRIITIYLGDQQTAAVVRGKIAKAKLEKTK